jgi:hypothetical protein
MLHFPTLCFFAPLLFIHLVNSNCGDCCSRSACSSAFQSSSGVCCGQSLAGQFFCCPTGASCVVRNRDSFVCRFDEEESGGSSLIAWLLPLLSVLLCCCGIPACIAWQRHKTESQIERQQNSNIQSGMQGNTASWGPTYAAQPSQFISSSDGQNVALPVGYTQNPFPGQARTIAEPPPPPYSPAVGVTASYPHIA